MMMEEVTATQRGTLNITQDRVVAIILRIINTDGLETAKEQFKTMNQLFCTEQGWAETAEIIYGIFAKQQEALRQKLFAEELALKKAGAASILMLNQNEANALKDARRLVTHDITMTGDHAQYNENSS